MRLPTDCASEKCVRVDEDTSTPTAQYQRHADTPLLSGGRRADEGTRNPTAASRKFFVPTPDEREGSVFPRTSTTHDRVSGPTVNLAYQHIGGWFNK